MNEFARQVVRVEVAPLPHLVPIVLLMKQREKTARSISGENVYCHFRVTPVDPQMDATTPKRQKLQCAFSKDQKLLLGETVRDWLGPSESNFLWAEKLGPAPSLVLVANGRVVKDVAEAQNFPVEVAAALGRLPAASSTVYLHTSISPDDLAEDLVESRQVRTLETSVVDRVKRLAGQEQARLGPINEIPAVRTWNAWWKWVRAGAFSAFLVAAIVVAYRFVPSGGPESQQHTQQTTELSLTEYDLLLKEPAPGRLLGAIHLAYRQFLGDPFFGDGWKVLGVTWQRASGKQVQMVAQLPYSPAKDAKDAPTPQDDVQYGVVREELAALQRAVDGYARDLGWTIATNGLRATMTLPLPPAALSAHVRDRRRQPQAEADRWHWRRMRRDFDAFGDLRRVSVERRTTSARQPQAAPPSYLTDTFTLHLSGVDWAYPDAALWIGDRFSGGPVVLDEVALERPTAGGTTTLREWKGRITFRTIWCRNDGLVNSCEPQDPVGAGETEAQVSRNEERTSPVASVLGA